MKKENEITVTYEQIESFRGLTNKFLHTYSKKFSKFLYALQQNMKLSKEAYEEYMEKSKEYHVELAAVDKDGFILLEGDRYKYKPEKEKELAGKIKKLKSETVTIKNYLYVGDDIPEGVSIANWDILAPFVLPELDENKLESLLNAQEEKNNSKVTIFNKK